LSRITAICLSGFSFLTSLSNSSVSAAFAVLNAVATSLPLIVINQNMDQLLGFNLIILSLYVINLLFRALLLAGSSTTLLHQAHYRSAKPA
jgi:hypothetical protein